MQTIDRIHAWAQACPDREAYCSRDGSLTYGALWGEAERLSGVLQALPEDRMILFGGKEPEMVIGILGCLLAGKTYIPISEDTPAPRLAQIRKLTAPCRLLTAGDPAPAADCLRIRALLREKPTSQDRPGPSIQPAYIIFTSGSTGVPKGVPISRKNLDHFTDWLCRLELMRLPAPAHVMNQASFSFDLSVADLFYSLCGGHTLYALPKEIASDPGQTTDFLRRNAVEAAVCTPTFLKLCLLDPAFEAGSVPTLQVIYSCGETLEPGDAAKLLQRFPGLRLINAYGPTEATSAVCAVRITEELIAGAHDLPVGSLDRAACEIRIEGDEIILKGDSVFNGYLDGSKGGYFLENGLSCYRTGDLGRIEGDLLYCKGRRDRQVKWKGYRIELDEIEHTILSVPGVRNCAVVAKKTDQGIVRLIKAFVVLEPGFHADALRNRLHEKLPRYMIPKSISELDEIPISDNKKIDRKKLETL